MYIETGGPNSEGYLYTFNDDTRLGRFGGTAISTRQRAKGEKRTVRLSQGNEMPKNKGTVYSAKCIVCFLFVT